MSKIIQLISKKNYCNSTNFQNHNKNINQTSNYFQRINETKNNYNIHYMNALNKNNISKQNLPFYKFIPSQNQEFYAINDGNVEYIIYNDEQEDINKNLNQKNNYTHLNNIKLIKTNNNCKENRNHHYTGNKIYEEYYSNKVLNTQPNTKIKFIIYLL